MKKIFLLLNLFIALNIFGQSTVVGDTIQADSWEDAMEKTFGLLPKSHYPSGYLINKASPIPKIAFANGTLTDSS